MTVSDWVLVATTLFLGSVALVVPWLSELVKRKAFAPVLEICFALKPPFCHMTYWGDPKYPVYYCRFWVINRGKSQARLCEAVLEDLWIYDASDKAIRFENFSPVNLNWVGADGKQFVDINPERRVFCDIGHLSSPAHEAVKVVDLPGTHPAVPRFVFDQRMIYFAQANSLVPGKYIIKVILYSENAHKQSFYFEITWSGRWQAGEKELVRELVVQKVDNISGLFSEG